jgi:hypothetical protein
MAFAGDSARMARFQREVKVLASLGDNASAPAPFTVVLNWQAGLKK